MVRNPVRDGVIKPHDALTARFDLCAFRRVRGQMMRFEVAVDNRPSVVGARFVGVRRRERRSKHPERGDHDPGNRAQQSTSHAAIIVARAGSVNLQAQMGTCAPRRARLFLGVASPEPVGALEIPAERGVFEWKISTCLRSSPRAHVPSTRRQVRP